MPDDPTAADRPTRLNRCTVIVPSGLEAPRTYRCWWPLPCPHHGGVRRWAGEIHVSVDGFLGSDPRRIVDEAVLRARGKRL